MDYQAILKTLPPHWNIMLPNASYQNICLSQEEHEYQSIKTLFQGSYYKEIKYIYRVQNPLTFAKFAHKLQEFAGRGPATVRTLYHDTSLTNVEPICWFNFNWRMSVRTKFGPGVYFSISPDLAARHSRKTGSSLRAMFLVDVIMLNVQKFDGLFAFLPNYGYDTLLAHRNQTYVKYFDNEYYPTYFMIYEAIQF
ncbi:hypothetical protein ABEB36_011906 [Hypothenemus hampei]|uniref:Poly [ADP-ribose] polymerase n=1 Tax=Hypothenemus hampei TaxID=57062 RepID=A0ABD1E9F0_HYPHA